MMSLLDRIHRFFGAENCPRCKRLVHLKFHHVVVMFEDEPPLFYQLSCPECDWISPVLETSIATDAARKFGYESAGQLMQEAYKRKCEAEANLLEEMKADEKV